MAVAALLTAGHAKAAGIKTYNTATAVGRAVMLQVHSSDGLLSDPGTRVVITVGNRAPRTILTGGDGYGYLSHTPRKAGRVSFTARRGDDEATGTLLVMAPEQAALLIEIDGGLRRHALFGDPMKGSQRVVRQLGENYTVILLYALGGQEFAATWMERHGFPEAFLLSSHKGRITRLLHKRGVRVAGFIGPAGHARDAACCTGRAMSFEKEKGVRYVTSWDEVMKIFEEDGK